jgi:hypothetical protein
LLALGNPLSLNRHYGLEKKISEAASRDKKSFDEVISEALEKALV